MSTQPVEIASGTGAVVGLVDTAKDALLAAFGSPVAVARIISPQLYAAEANEPDGTQMQVVFTNFTGPLGGSMAGSVATKLNAAYASGKIMDPATGEPMLAWPGQDYIATADDANATLTIQWVRGQIWIVYILWALVGAATIFFIYSALHRAKWAVSILRQINPTSPTSAVGSAQLFGVPVYLWLAGVGAAIAIPFGEERLSVYDRARRQITGGR